MGMILEVYRNIIKSVSWLCLVGDSKQINLVELNTTIKGVNIGPSVAGFTITSCLGFFKHPNRQGMYKQKVSWNADGWKYFGEYSLTMDLTLVKSNLNLTSHLTSMPQKWLKLHREGTKPVLSVCTTMKTKLNTSQVANIHQQTGHLSMKRTLCFVRSVDSSVSTKVIKLSIRHWQKGKLGVKDDWSRLAMDLTHYSNRHF